MFTQTREFRNDSSRFAANIATESLKHGNDGEFNKLGNDWRKKKNGDYWNAKYSTPLEILEGLKKQEHKQLIKKGLDPKSEEFKKAYQGYCEAWDGYFL